MRPEFNFLHSNFFSGTFLDSSKAVRRKLRCVPRGPDSDRFNPGSFHPCCCFKTAPRSPRYLCFAAADFIRRNCRAPRPAGGFAYTAVPLRKRRTDTILYPETPKGPGSVSRKDAPSVFSWAFPLFAHHFFGTEFSPTLEFFSPAMTDARQFPIPAVGAQPTGSSDSGSDGW